MRRGQHHSTSTLHALAMIAFCVCACRAAPNPKAPSSAEPPVTPVAPNPSDAWTAQVRFASPGARHRALEPLIGTFAAAARTWMDAASPAEDAHGTSENRWVLGGRFVQAELKLALQGMPFEGIQTLGFDNAKQRYVATWIDNMGTDISPVFEGTSDASGKVITIQGDVDDALKHSKLRVREVWTIESDQRHVLEMWSTATNGIETKVFELVCTRK